ncbi:hypothetical protein AB1L42_02260 [Thalassoglobus sp. JC818]|uniref:hypothetical protein n=1 Tax=Thalassoglobus sp. JC818 TaxID=3232136 RepID=UPI00345A71D2
MPIPLLLAETITTNVAQTGIGLGSVLAVVCSWQRNRSILWAIISAFLSWFYVIYFALTRRPDEVKNP